MEIGKAILGVFLSSFLGIVMNPTLMMASDSVAVTSINAEYSGPTKVTVVSGANTERGVDYEVSSVDPVVETPAFAELRVDNIEPAEGDTVAYVSEYQPIIVAADEEPEMVGDSITILGNTVALATTGALTENAGTENLAWLYGEKFIYGHNLSYVLGVMNAAYDGGWLVGSGFSVTMDGVTNYYTVVDAQIYTVKQASAKMNKFINATGHKLSIMTCYGENRLVIFAD